MKNWGKRKESHTQKKAEYSIQSPCCANVELQGYPFGLVWFGCAGPGF